MSVWAVGASIVVAGVSYYSSERGRDAQSKANSNAMDIQQEQLEFQRQQYEDWKDIYGDLQEDLGDYYKNINGGSVLPKQLETIEQSFQTRLAETNRTLAQQGLDSSGVKAYALMSSNFAETEAKNRAMNSVDNTVRQQQASFLSLGLGKDQQIANSMANTNSAMGNIAINNGNQQAQYYNQQANTVGSAVGYGIRTYQASNQVGANQVGASQADLNQAEDGGLF